METSVPFHVDALGSPSNDIADVPELSFSASNISTQFYESGKQPTRSRTTYFPYGLQVAGDPFEPFCLPLRVTERCFMPTESTRSTERFESRFSGRHQLQTERFTEIPDDSTLNLKKTNEVHDPGSFSSESPEGFRDGYLTELKKRCCILGLNLIK
jgi:hypothetical protein